MEWCSDWYNGDYSVQSVIDPLGAQEPDDEKCRIIRGGTEHYEDYEGNGYTLKNRNSRAAKRFYNRPTFRKVYYVKRGKWFSEKGYWLHGALTYPNGRKLVDFDVGFRLCCDSIPER